MCILPVFAYFGPPNHFAMPLPLTCVPKVREIVIAKELGENVPTRCSLGLASPTSNQGTLQADLEWKPFVSATEVQ